MMGVFLAAVLGMIFLAGCAQESATIPSDAQPMAAVDGATPATEAARETLAGCDYGNPSCSSGQDCRNNACVLKSGCDYDNPGCGSNHSCVANQCVLKSGCVYDNPPCNSSQICQANRCFEHILSGGGGY